MVNENDEKKNKIFVRLMGHRKLMTLIIMLLGVLLMILPQLIYHLDLIGNTDAGNKLTGIELISLSSGIVSSVFLILGTTIAVWQYCISSREKIIQMEKDRVEKAIDMVQYYKDNILKQYSIIREVYVKSGIIDIMSPVKAKMEEFDELEMQLILTESDIGKIHKILKSQHFIDVVSQANEKCKLDLLGFGTSQIVFNEKNKINYEVNNDDLVAEFMSYVTKTLNSVELFAMYFSHNIADESVVYPVIYPTYLELCRALYFNISKCSVPGKAKMYTNLVELYKVWNEKDSSQQNTLAKEMRNASYKRGTVASTMK